MRICDICHSSKRKIYTVIVHLRYLEDNKVEYDNKMKYDLCEKCGRKLMRFFVK